MFLGNSKRDIQSLKERTDEAIKGNEFHPIEIEDDGTMGDLGKNFNSLGLRLNAAIAKINDLSRNFPINLLNTRVLLINCL